VAPTKLPSVGTTLAGRYHLRQRLAAGGMGAVYAADDAHGGRVAVKLLHPELARDPAIYRRFRREGAILTALDHPAVVRVLDVGRDGDLLFTVMELLEGETLHARMHRCAPMAPSELAPLVTELCGALAELHQRGIVHGDLKPANIFLPDEVGSAARVKLVDFGLSKVHGLERLTRTGEVLGTPAYMAPELLTGEGAIDLRIDIYALGVILFEALAGRLPFDERNPGRLLFRIVAGDAPNLAELRPEVDPEVVRVVQRAMAPRAGERPGAVAALGQDFARAVGA
jgi:eukaryotic-like serine/threonine-protein kinase